jgi:protoheme ferro-lyase
MNISLIWIYELNAFYNLFQGELLCQKLDELSPETGPHKYYVAFRYASPLTEDTLDLIEK